MFTYDRDTEGHDVEGQGGNEHDHEDDPSKNQSSWDGWKDGRMVTIVCGCQCRWQSGRLGCCLGRRWGGGRPRRCAS